MRRLALSALLVSVCGALATAAAARPLLGVRGDRARFEALTGQRSSVGLAFLGWGQGATWGAPLRTVLSRLGPVPMLALKTGNGSRGSEVITPAAIARGEGDGYLIALSRALGARDDVVYVRPFPEMNGHWTPYCAYTAAGKPKRGGHSTRAFRRAFARVYLLLHGGTRDDLDARLARLGLPGVETDVPVNDRVRVIWNPQGVGAPNVRGNAAGAYYPGDRYVDLVGDDLYNQRGRAMWNAAERLYRAHPRKPFAFPEWGNWGIDDPRFVHRMARFVRSHPRLELLVWYESKPGSIFDLADKPRTRAAYRRLIARLA